MFQYVENGDGTNEILLDRSNLTSGVTIYWEDTNFTPIFHSLLINNLFYYLKNLIILSDNDDEVVFIYNNCEIEMKLQNIANEKEIRYNFQIINYSNDSDNSDDENYN